MTGEGFGGERNTRSEPESERSVGARGGKRIYLQGKNKIRALASQGKKGVERDFEGNGNFRGRKWDERAQRQDDSDWKR